MSLLLTPTWLKKEPAHYISRNLGRKVGRKVGGVRQRFPYKVCSLVWRHKCIIPGANTLTHHDSSPIYSSLNWSLCALHSQCTLSPFGWLAHWLQSSYPAVSGLCPATLFLLWFESLSSLVGKNPAQCITVIKLMTSHEITNCLWITGSWGLFT